MTKLAVIAFGGNALLKSGQKGTYKEQIQNISETCNALINLIKQDYNIVIGHGNGPQVGNVLLQHEAGKQIFGLPIMPMDFCVSETQGSIGYLIEQGFRNVFAHEGINRNVVTLVTQVVVNKEDPMFDNPTKPVGPYYSEDEAKAYAEKTGAIFREDPKGNGWRKVVPSPKPIRIHNIEIVKQLAEAGNIVVTVGGGGIPIFEENGFSRGVEAVIDKDLASSLAAVNINADMFCILTDVPYVYINYKKPDEQKLHVITVDEAKKYLEEGQFTEGSMGPKVRAAIFFIENGGKECLITDAANLGKINCGTKIIKNN